MSTKRPTRAGLRSFFSYLAQYKLRLVLVLFGFAFATVCLGVMPFAIGTLIGALAAHPLRGQEAVLITWLLIVLSVLHSLTWHGSELLYLRLIRPLGYRYENLLFRRVIQKPYPYFVDKFTGKISSYITTLGQELREFLDNVYYNYVGEVVGIAALVITLATVNWQTGIIFCLGLAGMILTGRYTIKNATEYEQRATDVMATKNGKLIDAIANFVNVKSFRKELSEIHNIETEQSAVLRSANASFVWGLVFWSSMSFFVRALIWPLSIGLNVYLFLHHQLSVAQLSTLLSAILLFSNTIWNSVWWISQFNLRQARVEEAHGYLFGGGYITSPEMASTSESRKPPAFLHSLTLTKLTFAYPDDLENPVLSGVTLNLKKGEKIGIVGHSGSGKTTLTKLMLGYYPVTQHQLLLDGQPIDTAQLAQLIAYVPQDTSLFHRSIAENISYATDREVSREEVVKAAQQAHADEFITKINGGYDALVGERGVKLSAGQRQRIAIARAFLDDRPILILDEATSALDSESEVLVQQALEALWQNKTVIAIAHRLSTLRHVDRIVVFDMGRIVEIGSHSQLLAQNGTYAKLWAHQSGGFIEE